MKKKWKIHLFKNKTNCLSSLNQESLIQNSYPDKSYNNDVTVRLLCSSTEENWSAPFCWLGKIEIKYLFSKLMQNNLFGVKMLFEIQKLQLNPLFFYLNNISPPQRLVCKHEDTSFIFKYTSILFKKLFNYPYILHLLMNMLI